MTIRHKEVEITCDECGATRVLEWVGFSEDKPVRYDHLLFREINHRQKQAGWGYHDGHGREDLCPGCWGKDPDRRW